MNIGHTVAYITEIDYTATENPDFFNMNMKRYTSEGGYWIKAVEDKNLQMCEISITPSGITHELPCTKFDYDVSKVFKEEQEFARQFYDSDGKHKKNNKKNADNRTEMKYLENNNADRKLKSDEPGFFEKHLLEKAKQAYFNCQKIETVGSAKGEDTGKVQKKWNNLKKVFGKAAAASNSNDMIDSGYAEYYFDPLVDDNVTSKRPTTRKKSILEGMFSCFGSTAGAATQVNTDNSSREKNISKNKVVARSPKTSTGDDNINKVSSLSELMNNNKQPLLQKTATATGWFFVPKFKIQRKKLF